MRNVKDATAEEFDATGQSRGHGSEIVRHSPAATLALWELR